MNILILNWRDSKNPKSGGAEIVTLEHAKAWIKAGNKVTWFTSKFKNSKTEEVIDGIKIVRAGNFFTVYLLAPIFYLFTKNKFDLVIDEIHGIPFFTPLYVRKPKIAFIHEVAGEIWDYMYPFPINKIGKLIEPLFYIPYKNTKFMTVSDSTKQSLMTVGIGKENIEVINNGISNPVLDEPSEKEKDPIFIFVSRVVKMKGTENVIKAFFGIQKQLKDAKLWIVGDGDKLYVEHLKQVIKTYPIKLKVQFFGKVNEQEKLVLMRKASLLLHASVKEGWGLVVIEAASQATPSVVYDVAGLRDSVKDGKTGVVLRENTPEEMAKQAINLFEDKVEYEKLQANSLAWAKSLTWENSTKRSDDLIDKVTNSRHE
jgi:glycosyltransferase involved in cell wall biosynthesis